MADKLYAIHVLYYLMCNLRLINFFLLLLLLYLQLVDAHAHSWFISLYCSSLVYIVVH